MRRRLSVRLRSDNPAGKGHFTILVVAPNPSSPASRGRITVYVPILCCVGRADPSRPHGLFSVTCIFFQTAFDNPPVNSGTELAGAPGDIRMKRTLIVAMVAPMVMPMASLFAASHASAADLPVPGPAPVRLGRGIYRDQWRLRGRAKRVGQRSAQSVRP